MPRQGKHRKEPTSGHFVQRSLRDNLSRICGERASAGTRRRNGAGSLFRENGKKEMEERMRDNPYKRLPPLERKPGSFLYRMTPAQRKQANALIRRECCHCDDGNCIALDDGDTHTCPQTASFSVCCKWFRCGVFVPTSNRGKYCPDCAAVVHRRQKAESERKRRSSVDN